MAKITIEEERALVEARHKIGLYSINEITTMFSVGRSLIDYAIATGSLKFLSPNNKAKFIYLQDFLDYMEKENQQKRVVDDNYNYNDSY